MNRVIILSLSFAFVSCTAEFEEPFPFSETPVASAFESSDFADCEISEAGFTNGLNGSGLEHLNSHEEGGMSSFGIAVVDFDQDGSSDLFFPQMNGQHEMCWGRGSGYFDCTQLESAEENPIFSVSVADYDGDLDVDLFLLGTWSVRVLRNDGNRLFTDVTEASGIEASGCMFTGAAWFDEDNDGDLDVLFYCHTEDIYPHLLTEDDAQATLGHEDGWAWTITPVSNQFFLNNDGRFARTSNSLSSNPGATMHVIVQDLDGDARNEISELNDVGDYLYNSRLFQHQNEDGWTDVMPATTTLRAPMGGMLIDLDNDGINDLIASGIDQIDLFQGIPNLEWVNTRLTWTDPSDFPTGTITWSVNRVDVEGDGIPELYISAGPLPPDIAITTYVEEQCDVLLKNMGTMTDPSFKAQNTLPSSVCANSRGLVFSDLNNDGVPDGVIRHVEGPPSILLGNCTENHRVSLSLIDESSQNVSGLGSEVSVVANGIIQTQIVSTNQGSFSGNDSTLFFGTGATPPEQIVVRWPDGITSVIVLPCSQCNMTIFR